MMLIRQSLCTLSGSRRTAILAVVLTSTVVLFSLSCEQVLDPRGPVDRHFVVFTVLSTDRNTQYVSVTAPFMPSGYGASEFYSSDVSVTDAYVRISGYQETYVLRDTLLSRPDSSQFTSPLRLYAVTPFAPKRQRAYSVYVSSKSFGVAEASVIMPGIPDISTTGATYLALLAPLNHASNESIDFLITLQPFAIVKGDVARLFLDFDILREHGWVRERVQVPISTLDTTAYGLANPVYPQLAESPSVTKFTVSFKNGYLISIMKVKQYAGYNWVYKQAVFQFLQADANLYSYYAASQFNSDPRSIRLDQPLYPTVGGGNYGMLGGYTLDSLVFDVSGVQQ